MVEIAAAPHMIEPPRYTAADVRWDTYEELVAFLAQHAAPGAEPEIFKNDQGQWVRWWAMDDPEVKRVNPDTGALESRQYSVERRVALSQEEATKPGNRWDFVLPAEPGGQIYGQPYVWMHEGRKPEVDPGFWYAQQARDRERRNPGAIRESWTPTPAAEAAAFVEKQMKLRESTSMTQVITATLAAQASAPAAGGKGK